MKGPRKRTEDDDLRFAQSFEKLIRMEKANEGSSKENDEQRKQLHGYFYIVYLFVKWKNEAENDGWLLIIA